MSLKIEQWIERLRAAQNPGPVVRITVARNSRDIGWSYDVDEDTNIAELAERIDNSTRNGGFWSCELRAFDAQGRFMEPLQHKVEGTQIVPHGGSGVSPGLQMGLEATVAASLKSNREFVELGLESMKQAQVIADRAMKRLEDENVELRKENERLRQRVADLWDVMEKLNTHEVETKHEMLKLEHMGRLGLTFTNALMGRVFGGNATPEGRSVNYELAMKLFESLRNDLGRVQQILPLLTEPERVAVMELMRAGTDTSVAGSANDASKVNGVAAASAAAAANVHGTEERSS